MCELLTDKGGSRGVAEGLCGADFRGELLLPSAQKSHSTCSPCQNSGVWPKKAPKRIDMTGVIARWLRTISLIARGGTPMARAMAF